MDSRNLCKEYKSAWDGLSQADKQKAMNLSEGYKAFLDSSKIEREAVANIVELAEKNSFKDIKKAIKDSARLNAGDKVYAVGMDKTVALFVVGKEPMEAGMNIIGSHVDSPRLDLKPNPLYEKQGISLLKTHYYGGIKKYQWAAIPLAIHGTVIKGNGDKLNVVIGENPKDPVVYISDLPKHLSSDQMERKLAVGIKGEELNIIFGSIPVEDADERKRVKHNVLLLLNQKYGIEEEDFVSAELEVVPSGQARDMGIDRGMIASYGHDDRICAYTSLRALLEVDVPERTCVAMFADREEVGSVGATGMHSRFFENAAAEVMELAEGYSELKLRRAMANSRMLSADVVVGVDPTFPEVYEENNAARMGGGIVLSKYTGHLGKSGCNDASAEFVGYMRRLFNENHITWQTGEMGKIDQGGGGTIAYILAAYGMDVIDCGVPLLSMHAPWEAASKADVYEAYRAYGAFFVDK